MRSAEETKVRILAAAEDSFARSGYHGTPVREICARARVNVAAINYHFGGKFELYRQVIDTLMSEALVPPDLQNAFSARPWQQRLREVVAVFVEAVSDRDQRRSLARIMAWELAAPSGVLEDLMSRRVLPHVEILRKILRSAIGRDCDETTENMLIVAVIGLITSFHHGERLWDLLEPNAPLRGPAAADRLVELLSVLAEGAIERFAEVRAGSPRSAGGLP